MDSRIQSVSVNAIASVSSSVILGLFSLKFFSWYKAGNKRTVILLLFGLATITLSMSILVDAIDKILLQQVIEEKSPSGTIPKSSYIYKVDEKYGGQIQYKVENEDTTTFYLVPTSLIPLHKFLVYLVSVPPYLFTWIAIVALLHQYYQRVGQKMFKFPLKYWIILAIPLVLYLIGSGLIISLPNDAVYRFYMRIIFRAGTIGSSVLFGLAFFVISRNVTSAKVKDYLTITAVGISTVGIANEVSALHQTYGVAAHSLVLLFSYLVGLGLYSSAIFLSQDGKLCASIRKSIRKTALEQAKSLVNIGATQLKQEIERKVLGIAKQQEETLTEQSGVQPSLTDEEMRQYLLGVLKDVKVIQKYEAILKKEKEIIKESGVFFVCIKPDSILLTYNNYFEVYKDMMNKHRNGKHEGIRWVTTIDNNNIYLIKEFLNIGVQIRHVKNMPPIDFAVSDREMITIVRGIETISSNSSKSSTDIVSMQNLLVSNEPAYLDHFISFFDELWSKGIDARDRIKVIEQGLEPEFLEVITDSQKASKILVSLVASIRKEVLILLPEDKAMVRVDKLGVIDHLINASIKGAVIKIICPLTETNQHIIRKLEKHAPQIKILNGNNFPVGMIIADNAKYLRAELSEPNAENFRESIGFTIYSNSKQSVKSFRLIFELLWNERMLVEGLEKADSMQKEFINVAAHELRNSIQPILGLTEHLRKNTKDKGQIELLDVVIRNAKKLKSLSENILDVTRIESNSFILDKRQFSLIELISSIVDDFRIHNNNSKNIKFEFDCMNDRLEVYGDMNRISQVISNLIDNSIKFISKEGNISITVEKKKSDIVSDNNDLVIVNVKDTGAGIHSEVLPLLFSKFATKSATGTGLGLYISKSIIEAHGGKIWAQNNWDGNGATFSFSLPTLNLKMLEIPSYQKDNE